jgi:hypothetical protein
MTTKQKLTSRLEILAVLACASLLANSIASAQTTNQATVRSSVAAKDQRGATGPLEVMKQSLSLSEDQAKKLEPVLKEHWDKMNALRRDTSLSRQDRVAKLKEMQTALDTKMKQHLTPEQTERWQKARFNQRPSALRQGQDATNRSPFAVRAQAGNGQQARPNWQNQVQQLQPPQPPPAQQGAAK